VKNDACVEARKAFSAAWWKEFGLWLFVMFSVAVSASLAAVVVVLELGVRTCGK
jgi:hypothetical protein